MPLQAPSGRTFADLRNPLLSLSRSQLIRPVSGWSVWSHVIKQAIRLFSDMKDAEYKCNLSESFKLLHAKFY